MMKTPTMMKAQARDAFLKFSEPLEARVNWMYIDTKGLVTVGVGNLIDPIEKALELPFYDAETGVPATREQKIAEWNMVKNHKDWMHILATTLGDKMNLFLGDAEINELCMARLADNEVALRAQFPNYDQMSADAQLALHSMAWALGTEGLRTKFPTFSKAMRGDAQGVPDYATAIEECRISNGNTDRNDANRLLLENAASVLAAGDNPEVLHYPRRHGGVAPSPSPNGAPAWLVGWWEVRSTGHTYYYYFAADGRVGWTHTRPTSEIQPMAAPQDLGSYTVDSEKVVSIRWNKTGSREQLFRSSGTGNEQMTGLLNGKDAVYATRFGPVVVIHTENEAPKRVDETSEQSTPPVIVAPVKNFIHIQPTRPTSPEVPFAHGDRAQCGEVLAVDRPLRSADGRFILVFQTDGNLVLYKGNVPLWASNTAGQPADRCVMQTDGNLVIYHRDGRPLWASNTHGHPGSHFIVQDDGNAVIYIDKQPLWATDTHEPEQANPVLKLIRHNANRGAAPAPVPAPVPPVSTPATPPVPAPLPPPASVPADGLKSFRGGLFKQSDSKGSDPPAAPASPTVTKGMVEQSRAAIAAKDPEAMRACLRQARDALRHSPLVPPSEAEEVLKYIRYFAMDTLSDAYALAEITKNNALNAARLVRPGEDLSAIAEDADSAFCNFIAPLIDVLLEGDPQRRFLYDNNAADSSKWGVIQANVLAALTLRASRRGLEQIGHRATAEAESRKIGKLPKGSWCGAFAYTQQHVAAGMDEHWFATMQGEGGIRSALSYAGTNDQWIWVHDHWELLKRYHENRGSLRWYAALDSVHPVAPVQGIRPGDIVLIDNDYGTDPDHITLCVSFDGQFLVTMGGNQGAGEMGVSRSGARELSKNPRPNDVRMLVNGVCAVNPVTNERLRDPSKLPKSIRIHGIGRWSIVDYEQRIYKQSAQQPTKPPSESELLKVL